MPRICTICSHPEREAIDRELVGGASNRAVASLCGVSEAAIRRHRSNHLPYRLAKSQEAQEVAQADDLLAQVRNLQERTLAILEAAEGTGEHRTALLAIREARSNLELLTKLADALDDSSSARNPLAGALTPTERMRRVEAWREENGLPPLEVFETHIPRGEAAEQEAAPWAA